MDNIRADLRLAGEVTRFHTWPHNRQQSVGEHSWQLARIYLCVVLEPKLEDLVFIQFHDVGEHHTGDIPYPVKVDNPVLKHEMDRLEDEAILKMVEVWDPWTGTDDGSLSNIEADSKALIKLCEFIEMWEYAAHELLRGNRLAMLVYQRCYEGIVERIKKMPDGPQKDRVRKYRDTRQNILSQQGLDPITGALR